MDLFDLNSCENYDKVCGQILLTTRGRLVLFCALCRKYRNYDSFVAHLMEQCFQFMDDELKQWITKGSLTSSVASDLLWANESIGLEDKTTIKETSVSCLTEIYNQFSEDSSNQEESTLQHSEENDVVDTSKHEDTLNVKKFKRTKCSRKREAGISPSTNEVKSLDNEDMSSQETSMYQFNGYDSNAEEDMLHQSIDEDVADQNDEKDIPIIDNSKNFKETKRSKRKPANSTQSATKVKITEKSKKMKLSKKKFKKNTPKEIIFAREVIRDVRLHKKYFPSHIAPEERQHECPICKLAFKNRHTMSQHRRRHTSDKQFDCLECDRKFFTSSEVKSHLRSHKKAPLNFLCTECGKAYVSGYLLKRHQKTHNNQRDYVCELCDKRFFGMTELARHRISHSTEKTHTCEICAATFKFRHGLKTHLKRHENKREFKCKVCEAAFNVKIGLDRHIKAKHKPIL